jgi:hypothetical protein
MSDEPTRKIFRYEFPVDDQWHLLKLSGAVYHVASRGSPDIIELWALHTGDITVDRWFRAFGTGHPLPDEMPLKHVGTGFAAGGVLVWHVFESTWAWVEAIKDRT